MKSDMQSILNKNDIFLIRIQYRDNLHYIYKPIQFNNEKNQKGI